MQIPYKKLALRPKEEVRAVVRYHWIRFIKPIAGLLVLVFSSLFFMYPLIARGPVGAAVFSALMITAAYIAGRELIVWYYTVVIITTERIIDMDRKGFFTKIVSEAQLEKIQDVSYGTAGIVQTIFGVGSVVVKTAANALTLGITTVKHPETISALIQDLILERTGKAVEAHEEKKLSISKKEELLSDIMQHEDLEVYDEYHLDDLIEEYKETYGELRLKKLLVDELETADEDAEK